MTLAELSGALLKSEAVFLNTFDNDSGQMETILDFEPFGNLPSDSKYWSHEVLWITMLVEMTEYGVQPVLKIEITA